MTGEPGVGAQPDAGWLRALPKAEVHLHLEGCIDHVLVVAASRRHGVAVPGGDPDAAPKITGLAQLLDYLDESCALIDRPEELDTIAYNTARRVAESGTRHVDVIFNPTHWTGFQGRLQSMIEGLDTGFRRAEEDGHATATLCVSLKRTQSESAALELVDWVLDARPTRISGLSIDGNEAQGSHNERFAPAFARAAEGGLRRCAHAGESSGAEGVREAIDWLGAERIDHGIRCIEDPDLVRELADRGIPLDVCPSSNVILGIVPDLGAHPIETLRRAGVRVSVNTDDPLLYGIDLAGEYARCAATFGWSEADALEVARTSITSCFADANRVSGLLAELDAAGHR